MSGNLSLTVRRFWHNLAELLEMIKIGHSVLALPFAFMGALLAARGLPDGRTVFFILVAMVGARSAAMAFNRLADAHIDAANPRTADRALPAGKISRRATILFIGVSAVLFMGAASQLNRICFALSPVALLVILGYSLTKRFTARVPPDSGAEPGVWRRWGAGWRSGATVGLPVLVLAGAVVFWVAGFDVLYALQDEEFDRRVGLFSVPARVGTDLGPPSGGSLPPGGSPGVCRHRPAGRFGSHLCRGRGGEFPDHSWCSTCAVRPGAPRLPPAFFTLNGLVGFALGLATWISLAI